MPIIELNPRTYSDAAIVEGIYQSFVANDKQRNRKMGYALYQLCREYYDQHFHAIFFVDEEHSRDIFQNSMVTLLEKIEERKIYVENDILIGKDGKPFTSTLTSFFMGIAMLKYKEWVREQEKLLEFLKNMSKDEPINILYDDAESIKSTIIKDCISKMPKRCSQILTLFYYEEKKLDEILKEIDSYISKNALKTEKYKCMQNLRAKANVIYNRYFK